MHPTITTILEPITRAPAPMIPVRITRIHNLNRDRAARANAIVIGVETAGAELVALPAGGAAVWLAAGVEGPGEELLVDGAVVDAGGGGPLPGGLAAVAGGAHPAVVLGGSVSVTDRGVDQGTGRTNRCRSYAVPSAWGAGRATAAYGGCLRTAGCWARVCGGTCC